MEPANTRLRIAMLGTRGIPANYGGFETCVEEVATRMAALGHDVTVYCRTPPVDYAGDAYRGVRLVKLPTIRNKYLDTVGHTTLSAIHAAIRRYDVVIVFGVGNSPQAFALRLAGLPVLLNVDGLDWKRAKWPLPARAMLRFAERIAGKAADRTITDSENVRAYYQQRHGVTLDFIPYGANPGPPEMNGQLASLGLEPDEYFLYVGRLEPENRVIDLVEAASAANIKRPVVVVGDAPYSDGYISLLRERGREHVRFPGAIYGDGYWELNHHAYAYVFPVASDGTHPALIEAMACGNPVLVRDIPDNRAVGGDAVRYFNTVDELVDLMEWVEQAPDEPRRLGEAARERVRLNFNWDQVTDDYLALARSVSRAPAAERTAPSPGDVARQAVDWLQAVTFGENSDSLPEALQSQPELLINQIAVHGLGPLLGQRVWSGELCISAEVDGWLASQVDHNHSRLELMRADLDRVLAAFERDGIEAIPLKGSAMLIDRPDEIGWRPMADIDLLVRQPDEQAVNLAYAHAGYCLSGLSWKHRVYGPCEAEVLNDHATGEHPDHPRDIESHPAVKEVFRGFEWDLTPWIVNNLRDCRGVPLPSPQAMSLHLAVHASIAALESTNRMIQIVDLSRQLAATGPDAILSAVFKSGAQHHARFVYPALAFVARCTGDVHVAAAADRLKPYLPPGMESWVDSCSFYETSWTFKQGRPMLDRLGIWARSRTEQAHMIRATLIPSPYQLASAGYEGDWPFAVPGWYQRYYLELASRARMRAATT